MFLPVSVWRNIITSSSSNSSGGGDGGVGSGGKCKGECKAIPVQALRVPGD